jgi:hypothetical protein
VGDFLFLAMMAGRWHECSMNRQPLAEFVCDNKPNRRPPNPLRTLLNKIHRIKSFVCHPVSVSGKGDSRAKGTNWKRVREISRSPCVKAEFWNLRQYLWPRKTTKLYWCKSQKIQRQESICLRQTLTPSIPETPAKSTAGANPGPLSDARDQRLFDRFGKRSPLGR